MTKKHVFDRLALMVFALICWPSPPCLAQPLAGVEENPPPSQPCVLLQNDNVLFGHAYQMGEFVVVQTGQGSEVQLSRKEVSCWSTSLRGLYQYRVDHRQQGNLTAHIRDARWCLQYDLFDLAAQEIAAAQQLDPASQAAKSVQDQLIRLTESRARTNSDAIAQPPAVQPVGYEDDHAQDESASVDLLSLRGFASHVQPMLLNRCARCHSDDTQRAWTLVVPSVGARASSQITHANLAASLRYLDPISPAESELLVKATTPHGGVGAPLSARNAKAIESLKRWIAMTVNSMPTSNAGYLQPDQQQPAQTPPPPTPYVAERGVIPDPVSLPDQATGQPERLPQVRKPVRSRSLQSTFSPRLPLVPHNPIPVVRSPIETVLAADVKVAAYLRPMLVMFAAPRVQVEPHAGAVQFTFARRFVIGDVTQQLLLQFARQVGPVRFVGLSL